MCSLVKLDHRAQHRGLVCFTHVTHEPVIVVARANQIAFNLIEFVVHDVISILWFHPMAYLMVTPLVAEIPTTSTG